MAIWFSGKECLWYGQSWPIHFFYNKISYCVLSKHSHCFWSYECVFGYQQVIINSHINLTRHLKQYSYPFSRRLLYFATFIYSFVPADALFVMCLEVRGQLLESVLSFHYVDSWRDLKQSELTVIALSESFQRP